MLITQPGSDYQLAAITLDAGRTLFGDHPNDFRDQLSSHRPS
jgi:hypothetical protein